MRMQPSDLVQQWSMFAKRGEFAWLGEQPMGWAIVRLPAKVHYLETAPVQILADPAPLGTVSDADLARLAENRY